jgi:ribosomal protein S27AE
MWKYDAMDAIKEASADGKVTFRPPNCPECGNALFRVNRVQMNFQVMTFDHSYGAFQEGLQHHDIHGRMVCPFCGHFLGVCKPA